MRSPTIARPISLFLDVDGTLLDDASHPDAVPAPLREAIEGTSVAVGPRIAGSGDLQLDAPEESLALLRELRDALAAGADSRRIGEVLRARTHA